MSSAVGLSEEDSGRIAGVRVRRGGPVAVDPVRLAMIMCRGGWSWRSRMTSCAGPGYGRCWVWRLMRSWVSVGPGVVELLFGVDRQQIIWAGLGAGAVVGSAVILELFTGPSM